MALLGSASSNLSPILFKGNNEFNGINIFIHSDSSYSMYPVIPAGSTSESKSLFADGTFIEAFQDFLLNRNIGNSLNDYPNLYAFFDEYARSISQSITIANSNGSLNIVDKRVIRGESSGLTTKNNWTNYYAAKSSAIIPKVTDPNSDGLMILSNGNNRLVGVSTDQISEDVHGNIFSIFYAPNTIQSGLVGPYGDVIKSGARFGSKNIVITASNEQSNSGPNMINVDLETQINLPNTFRLSPTDPTFNAPGFYARRYAGYFYVDDPLKNSNDQENISEWISNSTFETIKTPNQGTYSQIGVINADGTAAAGSLQFPVDSSGNNVRDNDYTWMILGYFKPPATGNYDFKLISNNASFLWIGDSAIQVDSITGLPFYVGSTAQAVVSNIGEATRSNYPMEANKYYPIRIVFGNIAGSQTSNVGTLCFAFKSSTSTNTWTTIGTGFFYGGINTWTQNQSEFFPPILDTVTKKINGVGGEVADRKYQIISLSSYTSNDGYDGVLFYPPGSTAPYKYVDLQNQTLVESFEAPTTAITRAWSPSYAVPPISYSITSPALQGGSAGSSGAIIKVDKYDSFYQASVTGIGTGYRVNDTFTINGDQLGEVNDSNTRLNLRVDSIRSVSHNFILDSTYNIANSSGSGAIFLVSKNTGNSYTVTVSPTNKGSGYLLNDILLITGNNLDGISGTNDVRFRVTQVTAGAIDTVVVESGTPTNYIDYTNRSGTNSGDFGIGGSGALFNIRRFSTNYNVLSLTSPGSGYSNGETITISGTTLGGISPDNDCIIDVVTVGASGEILVYAVSGTPDPTLVYTTSFTATNVGGSGTGSAFTVVRETDGTYTVTKTANGNSYFVNDRIRIPGGQLGGGGTNNLTITVTSVTGSGINGFTFTGTATVLNNPINSVVITSGQPYGIIPEGGTLQQTHDMLTLAQESYGALFKIDSVFKNGDPIDNSGSVDRRSNFANVLAQFISETL